MVAFQEYFYRLSLFIEYLFYIKTSCGDCQFKMKGKGCSLAIKLVGNNYFVANANIDDYGDAHEKKDSVIPSEKQKCRVRWWMGNS
jgi:hypothetical protein